MDWPTWKAAHTIHRIVIIFCSFLMLFHNPLSLEKSCAHQTGKKKTLKLNSLHFPPLLHLSLSPARKRKLTFSSDDDFCVFAIFSRASEFIDSPAATVEACRVHLTQHKKL